jgi:hypothetical protein
MARGRTVRDLAQGSGSLTDEPDGPRLEAGRFARTQGGRVEREIGLTFSIINFGG